MPFMKGRAPIRRTIEYLTSGRLMLKKNVRIFSINYNTFGEHHKGARDYVFWNLSQLQYKNPEVQVVTFKNMTPSPFIRCYFENGKDIIIDIDSQSREDIEAHLMRVLGKSEEVLEAEAKAAEKKDNPANFGFGCSKRCICNIPGQVPCPGVVPLPHHMRGKYKYQQKD
ncbi:probable 28S ribosomal protein S25, mitochondrial [Lutzomyia longipalpis]|uniref:Small ribosomal subunit protein mS25 n=1 Tax=Lutzomyia longipalpis TaxID=7200 RepID=A0A1B0C9N8_LUTLO|nr:probable 28S ribosomal protein S25, mitochondrial [Lutzomyia longipalpis]